MSQTYDIVTGSGMTIPFTGSSSGYITYLNTVNVISSTSDWVNDGGGKFTYVGTIPKLFIFNWLVQQTSCTFTSGFYWTCNMYLLKNSDKFPIRITMSDVTIRATGPYATTNTSQGVVTKLGQLFNPGDYFYVAFTAGAGISGSGTAYGVGFKLTITTY